DQLIGSSLAVVNAELRFPLTRSLVLGFLPVGLPPIEGAIFYDAGLAWNSNSKVLWSRTAAQEAQAGLYRAPLRSWGGSIRVNAGFRGAPARLHQAVEPVVQNAVLDVEPRPNVLTPHR